MGRTYLIIGAGIGLGFWITNSLHAPVMAWIVFGLSVLVALGVGVWALDSEGVKSDVRELREARASIREVRSDTDDDDDRVLDYPEDFDDEDDFDGDDFEDEYPAVSQSVTAAVQPAPPSSGGLLSSLRQQGGGAQ